MQTKRPKLILFTILCFTLASSSLVIQRMAAEQEDQDNYFAGTVIETAKDHLKVSGVRLGKTEERVFLMTAQTTVEGRLRVRVRVTVRYITDAKGDTATLVIIRPEPAKPKTK